MEISNVFCPDGFWKVGLTLPKWPLVGLCAHHQHHQQRNDSKHLSLVSFVSFFLILLWWRILHRYASTSRQRYVQKPLHRAAFMCRYSYTGVCAQINFYMQTPLHRGFYAKKLYTQKCLYIDALRKDAFTRMNTGTQALLHTEPFTHNLCTEQLLHKETCITQKALTQKKCPHRLHKEISTHRNFYTQKLYTPRAAFIHRNFSAQKPLGTEVCMHSRFYTGPFTHRCLYTEKLLHTETSAHSTLFHTASFYTERLCFPFLIIYLSCSPSQDLSSGSGWN